MTCAYSSATMMPMDPSHTKRKKNLLISFVIFIFILVGYLVFNYYTLKSNQAKNSRAEENELTTQTVRRINPSQALYSQAPLNTYAYTLNPTYLGGVKKLTLNFSSHDLKEQLLSVLESSHSPSEDVYSIVMRSTKNKSEKYITQFAGLELIDMIKTDGIITVENFPATNFTDSEVILFNIP